MSHRHVHAALAIAFGMGAFVGQALVAALRRMLRYQGGSA